MVQKIPYVQTERFWLFIQRLEYMCGVDKSRGGCYKLIKVNANVMVKVKMETSTDGLDGRRGERKNSRKC